MTVATKVYTTNCNTVCEDGSYPDVTDRRCKVCSAACETCYGKNSNQCYTCTGNYYYTNATTTCSLTCDVGYFKGANNICEQCNSTCETCTAADTCQ